MNSHTESRNSRNPGDKLSELKVLQELANVRVSNALTPNGQHNFTEGSIALGKVGNKKSGRLRFRISSGAIFSPSRLPEVHPIESLLKGTGYNTSHDETPSGETEKDASGKVAEKSDEDPKTGCTPRPEEFNAATEYADVVNNECAAMAVKKATALKIFKNIAQQFDALQDLLAEDACDCSNTFNRSRNRMTLENICHGQGNFTRVRFIRRKVTEKEKKPKVKSMEQLVADDDY